VPGKTYDAAVVGMGVAGLTAAVTIAEAGLSVALIDRATAPEAGGNTRYTEAFLRMKSVDEVSDDFEERFHGAMGYNVDPAIAGELLYGASRRTAVSKTLNIVDPAVISAWAAAAGPTLKWLQTQGVAFSEASPPFITVSTTRLAPVGGGAALVEALTAKALQHAIDIHYETQAVDLVLDEDGRVAGLRCRSAGRATTIVADQVVLACGGFEGNPEMLSRYVDRANFARPIARGGYYNRGEGIEMALRAGATTSGDFNLFHAEPIDPRSGVAEPALFIFPYGILVNADGKRFTDEAPGRVDATYEAITRRVLEQPGGQAWIILDAGVEDVPNHKLGIRTDQPAIVAQTLEQLAGLLQVPKAALLATVDEFNASCPDPAGFSPLTLDGLRTSDLEVPKSNWSRQIGTGPFKAYPIACANVFTFGGLKVNECGSVIDTGGSVIPGLYAAGEIVGTYFGTYVGSTSVLKGAILGRLSGSDIVAAKR
jgi:tricarballylate dehydrogenase